MKAFEDLRQRLLKAPILALPRHGAPYKLDTDACAYQVGCCLLQEQEDKTWHPIGYFSTSLTDAERNYSASERECLAVVWGVLILRPYLLGTQFTVRTDQHALRWLLNLTNVSGRLARWRLRLAEYEFEVEYRPGVKHQLADGMSRLRTASVFPETNIHTHSSDECVGVALPYTFKRRTYMNVQRHVHSYSECPREHTLGAMKF